MLGDEPPEHAAQEQELGHDLARREAERLAVAGVVAGDRGERAADPHAARASARSTSRPSSAMKVGMSPSWRDAGRGATSDGITSSAQALLDHLEGQLPAVRTQLGAEPPRAQPGTPRRRPPRHD